MVNWWFGFLGSPYERDSYLGAPRFEPQTTNPNHRMLSEIFSFAPPSQMFKKSETHMLLKLPCEASRPRVKANIENTYKQPLFNL